MRPRYETEADRQKETKLGLIITSILSGSNGLTSARPALKGASLVKLSEGLETAYKVDWCLVQKQHQIGYLNGPNIVGWAELKCRDHRLDQYETLILAAHKWSTARRMAFDTGVPFVLFVSFNDAIACHVEVGNSLCRYAVEWGGRNKNARDAGDIEPVVHIPIKDFVVLVQ